MPLAEATPQNRAASRGAGEARPLVLGVEASPAAAPAGGAAAAVAAATIFVVDDDQSRREAISILLTNAGYKVDAGAQIFLDSHPPEDRGCLITDVRMPGMNGLEMLARLAAAGSKLPAIIITGRGDIAMAVRAMRAGAVDFVEKPVASEALPTSVRRALQQASPAERNAVSGAAMRVAGLTKREREVMDLVVAGAPNKEIAARLRINQRTVETHRATVMTKLCMRSLSDLVRLTIAAEGETTSAGAEREMQNDLVETLRAAVRARDELISIVAHELRNPMTPILMQVERLLALAQRGTPPDQFAGLVRELDLLRRLIKNYLSRVTTLLDVSRITSGKLHLDFAAVNIARLFGRFERAVAQRRHGGFGVGLWLVRQLIEAMGGEISIKSRKGKGSTFTVMLPLNQSPPVGRGAIINVKHQ